MTETLTTERREWDLQALHSVLSRRTFIEWQRSLTPREPAEIVERVIFRPDSELTGQLRNTLIVMNEQAPDDRKLSTIDLFIAGVPVPTNDLKEIANQEPDEVRKPLLPTHILIANRQLQERLEHEGS
jgi:hypothetical protein